VLLIFRLLRTSTSACLPPPSQPVAGFRISSRDKAKIHELCNPMYKAWFPAGEDDPQIAVLKVDVTEAQYWEASPSKLVFGLKYLAAAVTGGVVSVGESGKVLV
jgi:hypothetical protein